MLTTRNVCEKTPYCGSHRQFLKDHLLQIFGYVYQTYDQCHSHCQSGVMHLHDINYSFARYYNGFQYFVGTYR